MYTSYFGFKEIPFNLTPDPRFLYLSPYHKEALDFMLSGIERRRGLVIIFGDTGTGKTTLCRALLNCLNPNTRSALILNSFITDRELLCLMNKEFAIETNPDEESAGTCIEGLKNFLVDVYRKGGNCVLLIDEAQNLPHATLRQIAELAQLQARGVNLINIILVGQYELGRIAESPVLKKRNTPILERYELKSLEGPDTSAYVKHRLSVAGGGERLRFTNRALKRIHAYSRGTPRRINAVCDRALLIAYVKGQDIVSEQLARMAIEELQGSHKTGACVGFWLPRRFLPSFLGVLLLGMVAGLFSWHLRERSSIDAPTSYRAPTPKITKPVPSRPGPSVPEDGTRLAPSFKYNETLREEPPDTIKERSILQRSAVAKPLSRTSNGNTGSTKRFSIQVGAFLNKKNAERLAADLERDGFNPYISRLPGYSGRNWYSVRILDCASLEDAALAAYEYRQKKGRPAIVTSIDSLNPISVKKKSQVGETTPR